MKFTSKEFHVPEGAAVSLKACPMRLEDPYKTKRQYAARLVEHIARLSAQQQLAHHARSARARPHLHFQPVLL